MKHVTRKIIAGTGYEVELRDRGGYTERSIIVKSLISVVRLLLYTVT